MKTSTFFEATDRMSQHFGHRLIRPWLWTNFLYFKTNAGKAFKIDVEVIYRLSRRVISERKQQLLENYSEMSDKRGERLSFLDLLLDIHLKDNSISLEDIREEIDTIMFAGHDTSAICLSWTFCFVGKIIKLAKNF